MPFEWDDAKAASNLKKHGVAFGEVHDFEFDTAIETIDEDLDYGEERRRAFGFIGSRLHVLVYTERNAAIRVVSLRRATIQEKRFYEEAIERGW